MIDLNHPLADSKFKAVGLLDRLWTIGQQMTLSPSSVRMGLLADCLPLLAQLRKLAEHFRDPRFIAQAIDDFESGIRNLAALGAGQILEDRRDGEGDCPCCGTKIIKSADGYIKVCGECANLFMPAMDRLRSIDGFADY